MKQFFKMVLAVIVGLLLMGLISLILLGSFFGALASTTSSTATKPVMPRSGVLNMDMSAMAIVEQPNPQNIDIQAVMNGSMVNQVSIWEAAEAIRLAAKDPVIKYIYLKPDGMSAGVAQLEEIRKALKDFRASGKAVVSYMESPTAASYYLASVADKVYMSSNVGAGPMMNGILSQMFFLKDLLDKLGVNVQLIRHGKYKSAGEMYIKNSPSPENLEQTQEMVNSMWNALTVEIADARGISIDRFNEMIDNLELNSSESMLSNNLVDELLTREELKSRLATFFVVDEFKDVKMVDFASYAKYAGASNEKAKKKIAVVYANGNIVEGDDYTNVAGNRFASTLAEIRADNTVKAVVLRVASPGGSVLASDKIKKEIDLLREVKPVIASYGDYAASGGYWISNSCDKIYSDNTTLTGSIGVFSMIPDLSKTAKDLLHVGITTVGSNKHSDMYTMLTPLDAEETAAMQEQVEYIYDKFVSTVAAGRDLSEAYVDSIAQGRVWTGADAIKLGLVDEIGTLEDAVAFAIVSAGGNGSIDGWNIASYPKAMTTMEMILSSLGSTVTPDNDVLAGTPFEMVGEAFKDWNFETSERIFARMPYEYVIK